ncbi:MAG: signal peptidase II [Bacteroidales bacterium]|nr:signal peptidase II [Bacteroidales bacterium]
MKKNRGKFLLLLGVLLVIADQVIKILVKTNMTLGQHINVLGNWFQLLFIENEGMAFGMAFGGVAGKYVLTLFRIALFVALTWWISKLLKRDKPVPTGVLVGLTLIAAGALGNIIDCLFYGIAFGQYAPLGQGRVVDMFYFPLWTWPDWVPWLGGHIFFEPIFNFADSCVSVGAIYLILFQWKFFASEEATDKKKKKK